MNILSGTPNRNIPHFPASTPKQAMLWAETTPNAGMNSNDDRVDIPANMFVDIKNAFVSEDRIESRSGVILYTPAKPDTDPVVTIALFKEFAGDDHLYRATENKIWEKAATDWDEVTAAGTPISGSSTDRLRFTGYNDRLFFVNGVDDVMEIDVGAQTYDSLGIGAWKYFAGFHERGIVAYDIDNDIPVKVAWTAQGDLSDITTDPSSGEFSLVEAERDYLDAITGLFSFNKELIIPRERSIWIATKLPSSTNPFQFYPTATGGIGGDLPDTITAIPNGIVFYNAYQNQVYVFFTANAGVIPIGDSIRNRLASSIDDPSKVWGFYNNRTAEYFLCVGHTTSMSVQVWTFSFRFKAWSYREYVNLTSLAEVRLGRSSLKVAELTGKVIDLVGKVEDLVATGDNSPRLLFGFSNGDICEENHDALEDEYVSAWTDFDTYTTNSRAFETIIEDKTSELPIQVFNVNKLTLPIIPRTACEIEIYFSKDNGLTYTLYKTVTFDGSEIGIRHRVTCLKNIKCNYYSWKIICNSGKFELHGKLIQSFQSGEKTGTKAGV